MGTMDCNLSDLRCKCRKCEQEKHHENRRVHDLIARLAIVVPTKIMEGLAGAVLNRFRSLFSPLELQELADFLGISVLRLLSTYEGQIARADALISSARCRSKDFARNAISAQILEQIAHKWWLPVDESQRIDLLMNGLPYSVRVPSGDGAWALQEVLFANIYNHKLPTVDIIYDLGSFIGVSALLLNSIYPDAHLTCVEPSPYNLLFLTDNLGSNLANFSIVPMAVFDGQREIGIVICKQPSMLNSARWGKGEERRCTIPTVSLRELVNSESFGIKIDIEGAEFFLESSANTFRSATWIMGELHFDELIAFKDMWLIDVLQQNFILEFSLPRFAEIDGQYIVAQEFWAYNKNIEKQS
jgi:FkbM family methyltransferase